MEELKREDKQIRVLIVEDSPLIARILSNILNSTSDIEVIGIAKDGEHAIRMSNDLKPDLITMDINLPKVNGYEATKYIMAYNPTPILVVSSTSYAVEMNMTFNAIYYGALDMIEKGELEMGGNNEDFAQVLLEKVRLLSKVRVIRHPMAKLEHMDKTFSAQKIKPPPPSLLNVFMVGIAASTGGPQVIFSILKDLPKTFNYAILIVQHIVPAFTQGFVEWLASGTKRDVNIAIAGERIIQNKIYVAPGDTHLKVSEKGEIVLSHAPNYKGHRPSANLLFKSLAENAKSKSMGVILSGMGSDGLEGLIEMHKTKAYIVAQEEQSCVVYGMPKVCIEAGIVTSIIPHAKIADEITRLTLSILGE